MCLVLPGVCYSMFFVCNSAGCISVNPLSADFLRIRLSANTKHRSLLAVQTHSQWEVHFLRGRLLERFSPGLASMLCYILCCLRQLLWGVLLTGTASVFHIASTVCVYTLHAALTSGLGFRSLVVSVLVCVGLVFAGYIPVGLARTHLLFWSIEQKEKRRERREQRERENKK